MMNLREQNILYIGEKNNEKELDYHNENLGSEGIGLFSRLV